MTVLVIDKPKGPTSFAVVAQVRRALGRKWPLVADPRRFKMGHGGTLDPMATGVLPICMGEATKVAPYLLDADKEYQADLRFGVQTDTLDAEGRVLVEQPVVGLTLQAVRTAAAAFLGRITQTPPMYSALKCDGKPLYEYARAGVEVERMPRQVTIFEFDVESFFSPDRCRIRARCSKGTYIRVLAADLGLALGLGAHLTALRRTASGPFKVDAALTLEGLETCLRMDAPLPVVSLVETLAHLPAVRATPAAAMALTQGKPVPCADLGWPTEGDGEIRILRPDGTLLAVAKRMPGEIVRTLRVFNPERALGAEPS